MSLLIQIQVTLEQVAHAISSALNVHVTIVDQDLKRLVTTQVTNINSKVVNSKNNIHDGSANAISLRSQKLLFIDNPRENESCAACGNKHTCIEFAEVCTPIIYKKKAVGVIGLVAYNDLQRQYLISNRAGVEDFLTQMADFISSKLRESDDQHALLKANKELDLLLEHMERAVIYADTLGEVLRINGVARKWLGINEGDKLPATFLLGRIESNLYNQSFIWDRSNSLRGIFDRHPISQDSGQSGFVYFLEPLDIAIGRYHALEGQLPTTTFDSLIGQSEVFQEVIRFAIKAARTSSTILLLGESGTGKELFARAIHFTSPRANKAFVAVNCGAIPENLLESELFGYEPGAFTGANKQGKPGKFEISNGGTLFLDEIGEMPLNLQVKLLRVIQERAVERIGAKAPTPIDVRIICATHCDLEKMVSEGEFREDLYYRIQVLPIKLPPLRERLSDIPELTWHLLKRKSERLQMSRNITIEDDVIEAFKNHRWTGNIRELENVIEYALNVDSDGIIGLEDLPNRFFSIVGRRASDYHFKTLAQIEADTIKNALSHFGKTKDGIGTICTILGISRATLYRKIKEYSL